MMYSIAATTAAQATALRARVWDGICMVKLMQDSAAGLGAVLALIEHFRRASATAVALGEDLQEARLCVPRNHWPSALSALAVHACGAISTYPAPAAAFQSEFLL